MYIYRTDEIHDPNANVKFNMAEIKRIMQQLLNGLYYIHSNNIPSVRWLYSYLLTNTDSIILDKDFLLWIEF